MTCYSFYEMFLKADEYWCSFPFIRDNLDIDTAYSILAEASKLSSEVILPLNKNSDEQGVLYSNNKVKTPDGFIEAYKEFSEGGWGRVLWES